MPWLHPERFSELMGCNDILICGYGVSISADFLVRRFFHRDGQPWCRGNYMRHLREGSPLNTVNDAPLLWARLCLTQRHQPASFCPAIPRSAEVGIHVISKLAPFRYNTLVDLVYRFGTNPIASSFLRKPALPRRRWCCLAFHSAT